MSGDQIQILVAMCVYLVSVIVIGIYYAKRANESSANYFIGGRKLGPWIAGHERGGIRYERLAAYGASGRCISVWPE